MVATAIVGSAVVGAGASAIGASKSSSAAKEAAQTQAAAADRAAALEQQRYETTRSDLMPWITKGTQSADVLAELTGTGPGGNPLTAPLTRPFQPTMEELAATPGYQFALDQGLLSVQNSWAAKGLGSSGAAIRGGVDYATGLASTTFQQQFQNYLAQNQQIYNMIAGQSQLGENAAAQTGAIGANLATSQAGAIMGAGNALAAGTVGSANAWANALGGVGNNATNAAMLYAMSEGGMFTKPAAPSAPVT